MLTSNYSKPGLQPGVIKNRLTLLVTLFITVAALPFLTAHTGASSGGGPVATTPAQAQSQGQAPEAKFHKSKKKPVRDQYIVVLKDDTPVQDIEPLSSTLAASHGGGVGRIYKNAIKGFVARMPESAARTLSEDPRVLYVEEDGMSTIKTAQWVSPWGWNLSRIDQRDYPNGTLDDYHYYSSASGAGVHVYVLDSGLRTTHEEFGGRATRDFDAFGGNGDDCNGHGTNVAGVIGGAVHGIAKEVRIHSVKVGPRDDNGNVSCSGTNVYDSEAIAGIDWVIVNRIRPAVANLSFGGSDSYSLDNAVRRCISSGVTVVVAAGNENANAGDASPSRVDEAIIVSATDSADRRGSLFGEFFANYGSVVDLFAPGAGIETTSHTGNTDTTITIGTSIAAPHVAGVAAQFLQTNPLADPDAVQAAIKYSAIRDQVIDPGEGTPNRLLYTMTGSTLMREEWVTVREYHYDVDTGIDINPGDWATIKVGGQIWAGWWWTDWNSAEGWDSITNDPNYPLPGSRPYSLLAKLGTSYFYIGRSNSTINNSLQTRRLYLRINDDVPGNGEGYFNCRVQVWRKLPNAESSFSYQSVPNVMTAGQTSSVTVTMQNTGETTWTAAEGYQLGSQNPQDNLTWGINRVQLPHSVPPGSQVTFTFDITAPTIPGTHNFRWRMVKEGDPVYGDFVQWFGDLSQNIPVTVVSTGNNATFVSQSAPGLMPVNGSNAVSVTMRNTGTTTWAAGSAYRLGSQNPQDNLTWGINRVQLPHSVPPGSQVTFTFNITAPSTIGTYNFQWRMVQDGVQWFGDMSQNVPIAVVAAENRAEFVSQLVYNRPEAGDVFDVWITMRNTGTTTWAAGSAYRLGSQNPQDNLTWGINRVQLPHSVPPGSQVTFNFAVTAPRRAGTYNFQWRMVQDGVEWFGGFTPNVSVRVINPINF